MGHDRSSGQLTGVAALWSEDRSRPGPRPALSATEIVEAAVRIADESGLDAVSMARIARALGFSTMALYRHVANKGELLEMMFDAGVGPADQTILDERGWRARMHAYGRNLSRVFRQRPWLMDIPVTAPPIGPNNIGWLELGLTVLSETGLGPQDRMDVYLTLSSYLLGSERITVEVTRAYQAALQSGTSTDQITAYGDTLRALLPPGRYPAVEAVLAAGVFDGEDGEDTYFGIERILDGVEALIVKRRQETTLGDG